MLVPGLCTHETWVKLHLNFHAYLWICAWKYGVCYNPVMSQ